MRRYIDIVVRFRVVVLLLVAAVSGLSAWKLTDAVVASSPKKLFFEESPAFDRYLDLSRAFANDRAILVAFESDDLFSPEVLGRLRAAEADLLEIPDVGHVDSLANAYRVKGRPGALDVDRVAELVEDSESAAAVRADITDNPLYRGLVVSEDGRASVMVVELIVDDERPAEEVPLLLEEVLSILEKHGFDRSNLHSSGLVALSAECVRVAYQTLTHITPVVAFLLMGLVYLLFRRLWPVFITSVVSAIGVLWTMAFATWLDPELNILLAAAPTVIAVISFSDVIHLVSAYLQLVTRGVPKDEAIRASGAEVGAACVLTSATTFCGFAAMMLIPTPVFRQLGLVLGFGVGVTLVVAVTLTPIAFSFMRAPREMPAGHPARRLVDWLVAASERLAVGSPRGVIAGFAVAAAIFVYGLTQFTVETDFVERLDADNPMAQADRFYAEHFAGTGSIDVYLSADEPSGLRDPELFGKIAGFQDTLAALPEVATARSLVDLIEHIHRELNAEVKDLARLPETRGAIAQYLLLFEMSGGGGLERLADPDGDQMRMSLALPGTGFRHVADTAERVRALAREHLGDQPVQAEVTGISTLFGDWIGEILAGQREGLAASFAVILLLMIVGLRSLRVGLWSMIPNTFPLLALGGVLGLYYDEVDSDTMIVAMIGIGIGVDDTIHFLSRFRIESMRRDTVEEAIHETFLFAGTPIVLTTLILGLGFMPLAFSDYYSTAIMGTLLPMTLVVALLADLLLVPALVEVGWLHFDGARARVTGKDSASKQIGLAEGS